ncbi:MAG: type IV secretory system conjugative DNA transfer family protein [Kordiimonadaceae bacterium]|nr:type IV secretory system conjugative DNA transfer family protein [Kordiimonadaceae bacterium]
MDSAFLDYDPNNPGAKILIGALGDKLIGIEDDRHIMTIAGSRAGKSVSLIGNMAFYRGSVLATDPKGELASKTAARRAELGQKVYVLDPFGKAKGAAKKFRAAYNPLTTLTLDNPYIIEDAALIADGLVLRSGQEKDPHWDETSKTFIMGVLLYVAMSKLFKDDERHLITVRHIISAGMIADPDTDEYILAREVARTARSLEADGHDEIAAAIEGSIRAFFEKSENERAGVLSTVRRHTDFLDYKSMKSVLTGHDFDLRDLKRAPNGVTIYLCLPAGRMSMCSRWIRIILNQMMEAMELEESKPEAPVLICLDEFPVLGFMKQLQDAAGQIAGFGVKLWVVLQDWGQGEELYGKRWESFAANAGVFQAFGNVDLTTTEYISKRLGKTRIESTRDGEVSADQRAKGLSGKSDANELYDLLTPDEVSRLFSRADQLRRQLVIYAGTHPMILQRVEYYDRNGPFYHLFAGKIEC